ncbi:MAG: hypothetical protein ACXQS8_03980 [Candidatus Helarchaeales archaeon]
MTYINIVLKLFFIILAFTTFQLDLEVLFDLTMIPFIITVTITAFLLPEKHLKLLILAVFLVLTVICMVALFLTAFFIYPQDFTLVVAWMMIMLIMA